jgi:hypothetical protein
MALAEETSWPLAVRVLSLLSAVLLIVVFLEARTVRQARAELQQLRSECQQRKAGSTASSARQPVEEAGAVRWLDLFYVEPAEGLGRKGMRAQLVKSDAYRAAHPELARPSIK